MRLVSNDSGGADSGVGSGMGPVGVAEPDLEGWNRLVFSSGSQSAWKREMRDFSYPAASVIRLAEFALVVLAGQSARALSGPPVIRISAKLLGRLQAAHLSLHSIPYRLMLSQQSISTM